VKQITVAIPYCLLGTFLIVVSILKMGHAAYAQALTCVAVGVCVEIVGLRLLRTH
jgi:hypothetical protein